MTADPRLPALQQMDSQMPERALPTELVRLTVDAIAFLKCLGMMRQDESKPDQEMWPHGRWYTRRSHTGPYFHIGNDVTERFAVVRTEDYANLICGLLSAWDAASKHSIGDTALQQGREG